MVTIFLGGIRPLAPGNEPSGIFKLEQSAPVWLGRNGLAGDAQADRRVHGGPEKALHQYPPAHYARLAQAFPALATALVPGSIGENLSAAGWDETKVCIGDVFRLGAARIQVSQPRAPCWKIDRRYGVEGMMQFIAAAGLTGWYFRVVEEGEVAPGCTFERIASPAPQATLARLWQLWRAPQPDAQALLALAATPGLAANWVNKLTGRGA